MTTVATRGNVLCTNYQQSGNALVPNRCYSSTPLEAAPAVFVNATHRFFGIQVQAKQVRSQQPRSLPPICLTTPISAAPTDYVHGPRLSTASASLDPDLPVAVGRKKEHHVRPRRPIPHPPGPLAAAVHRCSSPLRSIALALQRQKQRRFVGCRGLQHAACRRTQHFIALSARVFSRREYVCAYVAVKKNSFHFPPRQKKTGIGCVCRVGGPPPLGYFYLKDLWWPETDGF
jgi:hypothetical protein